MTVIVEAATFLVGGDKCSFLPLPCSHTNNPWLDTLQHLWNNHTTNPVTQPMPSITKSTPHHPKPTSVADFPFGDELGSFLLKLSLQCKLKGVFPAYIQAITWDDFSSSHKIYNPQYHYLTTSLKTVFPCVHRQEWHPDTCKIRCAAAVIGMPYMTGMIFYTYNG